MANWTPDLASPKIEERMEAADLPESDRDEVRRLAEFLRRKRDQQDGKELPPLSEKMKLWLLGET